MTLLFFRQVVTLKTEKDGFRYSPRLQVAVAIVICWCMMMTAGWITFLKLFLTVRQAVEERIRLCAPTK